MTDQHHEHGCGCDCGCSRRDFLGAAGIAAGAAAFTSLEGPAVAAEASARTQKKPAVVKAAFLYPPSTTFSDNPDGWWSWPGNDFDAEGRQRQYTEAIRGMEKELGVRVATDDKPLSTAADAQKFIEQFKADPPDGLLLMMLYNNSISLANTILQAAEEAGIPVIFYIGLGVKHGSVAGYRRPGVYFIQSLDNMDAISYGLRMIQAKKTMGQTRLLSVTEADEPRDGVEAFFGIKVHVTPFRQYAELFEQVKIDDKARKFIKDFSADAMENRGVTREAMENAARAHFALLGLMEQENADGVTMNCLRRGMLKPCMSFSALNGQLIPAACENDLPAVYTQLLGQLLTGRPGFQHNPAFETENNNYYGSHCTCATKLQGPDGPASPHLIRRFAHTNEGSCAIQVFYETDQPVTMVHYYPGDKPMLDVYAGRVVTSHPMPPAGGCTTNVEIKLTDRTDACMVVGHHNQLFLGDFARKFRLFAQLYKLELMETGFEGPLPV